MTKDQPQQSSPPAAPSAAPVRRPYESPVLRQLGSVRDLTHGNGNTVHDHGPLRKPTP